MSVTERRPLLPFVWTRAHHLVLLSGDERCKAFRRSDTATRALLGACRLAGGPISVSRLAPDTFEKVLVLSYQHDSAETHCTMASIGNELDLYTFAKELPDINDLLGSEDDTSIIRLTNAILAKIIKEKTSDTHTETYECHLRIRLRVGGVLRETLRPQWWLAVLLISRIKVMASLDITGKRTSQDGQMTLRIGGRMIDVCVSTLPSSHGEHIILRLLGENSINLDLLTLGMPPALSDRVDALIAWPHDIILVIGPTGPGKSTILCTALSRLDAYERNIVTIGDPVEYKLEGTGQTQINTKVDMTFARDLRAILCQGPDVALVGEIRGGKTVQIAAQVSLTGHLMLSTPHTNSTLGVISRPQDMGAESFLLSTPLLVVVSQRLVRQLCPYYRQPTQADADITQQMAVSIGAWLWQPKGYPERSFIGYRRRTGVHRLLLVDGRIRATIHHDENEITLIQQLGLAWQTLSHTECDKVLTGIISWEEVMRITEQQTTESV